MIGTMRSRRRTWLAAAATIIAVNAGVGCSGDDADGADGADAEQEERDAFCDALRPISEADKETSALVADGADWSVVQARIAESMPSTVEAYTPAIDAAPDGLVADLELMRDFSAETVRAAADASSFEEFGNAVGQLPDAGPVAAAAVRVDEVVTDRCIFSISDN